MICHGLTRRGNQCHFIGRYNGYCGHHRYQRQPQPRILNRERKCILSTCLNQVEVSEFIFCHYHTQLEHTNRCMHYENGQRCRTITQLHETFCNQHDILFNLETYIENIQHMSWGNNRNLVYFRESLVPLNQPLEKSKPIIKKIVLIDKLENNTCSICFEDFELQKEIYQLKCNHHFHIKCMDEWLKQKHTCPLDRSKIE